MGSFNDFLENEILDQIFGAQAYTAPATLYIGLWTSALTDASTGSTAGEVSGGSYARVAFTNNKTNWTTASGGALDNAVAITFAQATASWGTVSYVGICDAATVGNMLGWAALTTAKAVGSGDTAQFAVGALDVTLD